ncbi:ATP synthase subunit I [Nitrincola alkalilacustris]|uniref:ATP synthase subunit I n=1 Tax=Nitrincola alkalilacustris TaxID=1571224 RepID=UPI00124F5D34|nr:ATP synthase subunit I [Nitrincola alkalilacustris]
MRSTSADKQNKRLALQFFRILFIQTAMVSLLSILGLLNSLVTAYSILLGGMLYLLPNIYFTARALLGKQLHEPKQILARIYVSELGKMLLAVALFSVTFMLVHPLSPFSLFGTYILLQISGWYLQFGLNNRFQKL